MSELIELLHKRATLLSLVRAFFADRDVTEVHTSVLSQAAISDPAIESFAVDATPTRYLRTSPEFSLKRLLCAGAPDIYEMGPVFRQGEAGRRHNPEFTLLEWYRHGFSMQNLINEVVDLLRHTGLLTGNSAADKTSSDVPARECDNQVTQTTYADAFQQTIGVDILSCSAHELALIAASLGPAPDAPMDKDQWLDYLFALHIQTAYARLPCWVVTHYPASQAALARLDPDKPDFALRFEVFVGDMEIANGFEELQDAREQAQRFARDNQLREQRGQAVRPVDQRFLKALEMGLPSCSGVALGVDRLMMCLHGGKDIRAGLAWPWELS